MAGNKIGGQKAARVNKERHGEDFYARIAIEANKAWEQNGRKPRGFAAVSPEKRRAAGAKGGSVSRRA